MSLMDLNGGWNCFRLLSLKRYWMTGSHSRQIYNNVTLPSESQVGPENSTVRVNGVIVTEYRWMS